MVVRQKDGRSADRLIIKGEVDLINYLAAVLPTQQGHMWRDVKNTVVPADIAQYGREVERICQTVEDIRKRVVAWQSVIDAIVLDLYGINEAGEREMILGGAI